MSGDPLGVRKAGIVRCVLCAEAKSYIKVPLYLYEKTVPKIGATHLDHIAQCSPKKVNAGVGAALVLARPLDPNKIDQLIEKICDRNEDGISPGTEKAIYRYLGKDIRGSNQIMRTLTKGLVMYLKNQTRMAYFIISV